MASTTAPTDPKAVQLAARFKYQLQQFAKGVDTATQRIPAVIAEANAAGFTLPSPASLGVEVTEDLAVLLDGGTFHEATATGDGKTAARAEKKEKEAMRLSRVAEAKAARKAKKDAKPARVKVAKEAGPCLDGCGAIVTRPTKFTPGHDAKLKSLLLKIERGEVPMDELPEVAKALCKFKKGDAISKETKDGDKVVKTKIQTYICTEAPVKLPARQ